jgi:hypothetical protein
MGIRTGSVKGGMSSRPIPEALRRRSVREMVGVFQHFGVATAELQKSISKQPV